MARKSIAIIGVGKIAEDQHLPVIDRSPDFELAAVVSQRGVQVGGVPTFATPAELYAAMPGLDAVAICTPPGVRHAIVCEALDAGVDVLMEKPPTTTISELDDLVARARKADRVLFATWHSQFNKAVDKVRKDLSRNGVRRVRIDWRENVRKWHPGQEWVWAPGGFGVFDPGINALSIFTRIMPQPVFVTDATLSFPANRQTPIAAEIKFRAAGTGSEPELTAGFDWREEDGEVWRFEIETGDGRRLALSGGGRRLEIDGELALEHESEEYEGIYARFAKLLKKGRSDVDAAPLKLVADAFLVGARQTVDAFDWQPVSLVGEPAQEN